jgi:hypothetical protein
VGQVPRQPALTDIRAVFDRLPRLEASEHQVTSRPTDKYNCVAWVQRDLDHRWDPDFYWPADLPCPEGPPDLDCYLELFRRWGFSPCNDGIYEPGRLKIAVYSKDGYFHHVAKQLRIEAWSSKIGEAHDLWHRQVEALYDSTVFYNGATVTHYLVREDDGQPMELEESGLIRS